MRVAILADIHANLEALEACLADAQQRAIDRWVFLGDIVGYGADPVACLEHVREACAKGAVAVKGNHDEAACGARFRLNESAAAAASWTAGLLSAEQKDFLTQLPLTIVEENRLYVHASADRPEAYPYVLGRDEAMASLRATPAQTTVCGHVHSPALYHLAATGKIMAYRPVSNTPIPLSPQRRWLAVLGSVGQPRDGNPAAAYGILDTAAGALSFMRVPYDVDAAAAKIRKAGLPDSLWKRLSLGR